MNHFVSAVIATACLLATSAHAADKEGAKPSGNPQAGAGAASAALGLLGMSAPRAFSLNYNGWIAPDKDPTSIQQQRVALQVPVYRGEVDTFSLSATGSSLHFNDPQQLLPNGALVPADLWRIDFGGQYSRKLNNDKMLGGRLSFGSASDHPFSKITTDTIGASLFYGLPPDENSRWILTLFVSNNNPIINYVPIPGFVYLYQTKTFTGMFGLPFGLIQWTPKVPWSLSLSAFGPTINSEVACGDPRKVQLYAGFNWVQQSYLRENRVDRKDRLFFDEKRGQLGVRFPLVAMLAADLQSGFAFDRSAFEGRRFGKHDRGTAGLRSSWFAAWSLKARF